MVTYVKALQYWEKKAKLPVPDQPHHLAGSVAKLQWVMEPLVSFTEEEVFTTIQPSNWIEVRSLRSAESTPQDHSQSQSQSHWAHPRGSVLAAHGIRKPTATTQMTSQNTLPPGGGAMTKPQQQAPMPSARVCGNHKIPVGEGPL